MDTSTIRALTFDVFGTVVDWRNSIIEEGRRLGVEWGIEVDWARFADQWRRGYEPAMDQVRKGELPWTTIDRLHRMILDDLLDRHGITGLSEGQKGYLNRVWHRLSPWPDAVEGLQRVRNHFIVASLSNGNVSLLINMAKHAGLPWDCVLSAEFSKRYKPDPEVYTTAVELLGLQVDQVMMVAAHEHDLRGAQAVGMKTAYVSRPEEFGQGRAQDVSDGLPSFDLYAMDFLDLSEKLGA